jgi:Ser/Thr protein kinase RdoA (MazF antagonist)
MAVRYFLDLGEPGSALAYAMRCLRIAPLEGASWRSLGAIVRRGDFIPGLTMASDMHSARPTDWTSIRSYAVRELQSATGNVQPDRIVCIPLVHREGHCIFGGDTLILESGCYRANFEIDIAAYKFAEDPLIIIDIYENLLTNAVLAERRVDASDLVTGIFAVEFFAFNGQRIEFRVFWREQCVLCVTGLVLYQLKGSSGEARGPKKFSEDVPHDVERAELFESIWPLSHVRLGPVLQERDGRVVRTLDASEGRFVVKAAPTSASLERIERDSAVYDFLNRRGFRHIPRLLKTREQRGYHVTTGQILSVMDFVDGPLMQHTAANWRRLGQIAAQLHRFVDYPHQSDFTVTEEVRKMIENAGTFAFAEEYLEAVGALPSFEQLTETLIHTDMGPNNAIEAADGNLILVDWDYSGRGPAVLDIGFPLICHFVTGELKFEAEKARAFYAGYFAEAQLSEVDRYRLFDAGLFCALMYVPYGDIENNWARVQFAMMHRHEISPVLERS